MQKLVKNRNTKGTFQGIVLQEISKIIEKYPELKFSKITQNENVFIENKRFQTDLILYSSIDVSKKVIIEVTLDKNTTSDKIVNKLFIISNDCFFDFFTIISPFEFHIFKTYEKGKNRQERKIKTEIITEKIINFNFTSKSYINILKSKLEILLKELNTLLYSEL